MEDHIYVDISVLNNDRTGQAQNAPVSYNEARNSNILTDPDNYYMSIVRAQVDTGGYSGPPLLLPMVDLNNFNIDQDQLIYTISTATKSGATYDNLHTINVHWNAQNQAAPPPSKTTKPVNPVALPPVTVSVGNASISTTASFNTLDLTANAPVATINAAYVGSGVESNASIRYIWNAGTYDCNAFLATITIPGFTSPVDFTGWTIDTNPSDGTMLIENGSIVIEQNQSGSDLVLTLDREPTDGTFTRTDNSTRQLLFINTSTPLFEPNTTITNYPQGLNPIVTISPSASLIVPSPQDAKGPPVQFFTALYNVNSNSSPIDLDPLLLHWGGPAPTINKYVGGIMTSNLTFAFAYNAGAPTSFAGSGNIITPSIVFTTADANNDTSYINNGQLAIIPGLTESISTVTSHTFSLYALQYTTFQNRTQMISYNGSSLVYGNYLHVDASDPPYNPSVITNCTFSPVLINYNYGFQTPCTFVLDAPNASMSFLDPSMGISALPLNYQAYYGTTVLFDVLNSTIWFSTVAIDIVEISIVNGNYVKILFGPKFSFGGEVPSTLALVRNVKFQFNPPAWIAPSLPLTISSYTDSSTVTLTSAGTDPTTLLPFLFINFLAPATAATVFANMNFQMMGTPLNTLAYQLNLQVNPPPIQNTITPASAVYINNCNFNFTSTVISNSVPDVDGNSTFIVTPTWPTPYIPTTSNASADLIYALITATIDQPDFSNSWTSAIIGCVLDPIESQYALTSINTTTGYYNTFSVNWFIACINAAFADLAARADTLACYMFADPLTNLITIKTPPAFLATEFMFFNEPLAALFNCFTMRYIGNSGLPFVNPTDTATVKARPYILNYQLQFYKNNLESPDRQGFVSTTGLVSPVPAWSPILSVSFASNLIPHVLSNSTAAQSRTPSLTNIPSGQSQISNIITDITVPLTSGNEPRPQILYTPAIYRMIDLHGTQSLSNLDLQLFYKDKYGVLTPMRLGAQQFFSAKLLFRRRRFDLLNLAPYDS